MTPPNDKMRARTCRNRAHIPARNRPQTGVKLTIEASDQKTLIDVLARLARIGSDHKERPNESPPWMDLPQPDI